MAVYSHHDDCFLILVSKEMHGEERIHNEMETAQGKTKNGEERKDDGRTPQANG